MSKTEDNNALVAIEERIAFGEKEYSGVAAEYLDALRTAADALRERMEREGRCEICRNPDPCENCDGFCDICDIPEVTRSIHKTGIYRYCPMCGRKLPKPPEEDNNAKT